MNEETPAPGAAPGARSDPMERVALVAFLGRRLLWFVVGAILVWRAIGALRQSPSGAGSTGDLLMGAVGALLGAYAIRSAASVLWRRPR